MELKRNKIGILVLSYEYFIERYFNNPFNNPNNNFIYNKNLISKNDFDAHSRIINNQLFGIYFTKNDI